MLKIAVPYTMDANAKLIMNILQWPDRCACCGCPHPTTRATLSHMARVKVTRSSLAGNYEVITRSGYPLSWQIPCCEACLAHEKQARNPVPVSLLLVVGFLIALGVGYALYDAGYSDNGLVIAGYALLVALLAPLGWALYRGVGALRIKQATQMMTRDCTNPKPAVTAISDLSCITYTFSNDAYARDFASLNQL